MKICIHCNVEFEERTKHSKYCSKKCSQKASWIKRKEKLDSDPNIRKMDNENKKNWKKKYYSENEDKRLERKSRENITRKARRKGIKCDPLDKCRKKPWNARNKYVSKHGYIIIYNNHENSWTNGGIFEHVYVMSEHLGRPLRKGENVHHKNGIRDDNRIENLELWSKSQPPGQRVEDKLKWCKEYIEQYGHVVILKEKLVS